VIRVRPATPEDADAVARVHVDAWHKAYDARVPAAMRDPVTYESRQQMWEVLLERYRETHPAFVAETEAGRVVGFAMVGPAGEGSPGFDGEIHMLYVAPGYQRRDLGRRLFQTLVPVLVTLGCASAVASVLETDQAVGFFTAMGGEDLVAMDLDVPGHVLMQHVFGWRNLVQLLSTLEQ
jgi:L-amino acid N-acyltransferase YncA